MDMKFIQTSLAVGLVLAGSGCQSLDGGGSLGRNSAAHQAVTAGIAAEPKGAYYVGRRYFKTDYKFWGWVRRSGEPWSSAKLVMMNEHQRLIPDRQAGKLGSDNDYEYKLSGDFSGDTVYEPASNGFYPEFVLRGYELISAKPGPIYQTPGATDPERRVIAKPY
jgi:hypothetical protein